MGYGYGYSYGVSRRGWRRAGIPGETPANTELSPEATSINITLTASKKGGKKTADVATWQSARTSVAASGKVYFEAEATVLSGLQEAAFGLMNATFALDGGEPGGANSAAYQSVGRSGDEGTFTARTAFVQNERVMFAYDSGNGKFWIGRLGTWVGDPAADTGEAGIISGTLYPGISLKTLGGEIYLYLSAADWLYSAPAGWGSLANPGEAAAGVTTSYANTGGTGDRTEIIRATSDGIAFQNGLPSTLVNGTSLNDCSFTTVTGDGTGSLVYDFGVSKVIDEIRWLQSTTDSHGTWQVEGSADGASYSAIGSTFTLGGATTSLITSVSGNTTAYRYYRLKHMSGTRTSVPYLYEIEFKIGGDDVTVASTSYANSGGTGDRTALITGSSTVSFQVGSATKLIDGASLNDCYFATSSAAGNVTFDFGTARTITEITWKQSSSTAHGVWQWQGSADGSTYVSIGDTFTLGGRSTQVIQTPLFNTTAYRYHRLLFVSGTRSNSPYLYEIEFKISA